MMMSTHLVNVSQNNQGFVPEYFVIIRFLPNKYKAKVKSTLKMNNSIINLFEKILHDFNDY